MRSFVALVAAVNPPAVAWTLRHGPRRNAIVPALALALGLVVVSAGTSQAVLDAIDVTPPTFRLATAVVLGVASVRRLVVGLDPVVDPEPGGDGRRWVGAALVLAAVVTPQLVAVSLSVGADAGAWMVAGGAGGALGLSWLLVSLPPRRRLVWAAGSRLVGAVGIVAAVALAVDAVKSV